MLTAGLVEYDVNFMEYGFFVEPQYLDAKRYKLHIPKLMTFPRSTPSVIKTNFNNRIFVNDSECRPLCNASASTQNYITVPKLSSVTVPHANEGDKCILHLMEKNIRDMYITHVMDGEDINE